MENKNNNANTSNFNQNPSDNTPLNVNLEEIINQDGVLKLDKNGNPEGELLDFNSLMASGLDLSSNSAYMDIAEPMVQDVFANIPEFPTDNNININSAIDYGTGLNIEDSSKQKDNLSNNNIYQNNLVENFNKIIQSTTLTNTNTSLNTDLSVPTPENHPINTPIEEISDDDYEMHNTNSLFGLESSSESYSSPKSIMEDTMNVNTNTETKGGLDDIEHDTSITEFNDIDETSELAKNETRKVQVSDLVKATFEKEKFRSTNSTAQICDLFEIEQEVCSLIQLAANAIKILTPSVLKTPDDGNNIFDGDIPGVSTEEYRFSIARNFEKLISEFMGKSADIQNRICKHHTNLLRSGIAETNIPFTATSAGPERELENWTLALNMLSNELETICKSAN
ncbi:hypothetical protein BB559_005068 [Furculomyces boomerangus]|uniref:Mediator of RNA polymerase II transcription subunit 11 n=2 Tax=Harpellales TaxID=61421 RepID=A0A2T9YB79_9FUNG|nr:hypothetical protein BB559_005068 [Furculomyces boomerangus]PWA00079.1 hypothetical protein BB558_003908 [Smittium angustum]PWA02479.1 hypothetical protein BB558_001349 [Smittium angustum]